MGGFIAVNLPVIGKEKFPFSFNGPSEDERLLRVLDICDVMGEAFSKDTLSFDGFFIF